MSPGEIIDAPTGPRLREPPPDAPKAPRKCSPPQDAPRASRDRRGRSRSRSRSRTVSRSRRRRTGSLPRGLRSRYTPADTRAPPLKMVERRSSRSRSRSCSVSRSRRRRTDSLPRHSYDSYPRVEADKYAPSPMPDGRRTHSRSRSVSRSRRRRISSLPRGLRSDKYTPKDTNASSSKMAERRRSRSRSRDRSPRGQRSPRRKSHRHRTYSITPSPPREADRRRSPRRQSPTHQRRDKSRDRASPSPSRRRGRSRSQDLHSRETDRNMPSRPQTEVPANRARKSSGYSRKILSYDDLSEQRPKRNHEKMIEAYEVQDEVKKKVRLEKEAPKVNVLEHKPALSYDNQSEDGFMDLDTIISRQSLKTAAITATSTNVSGPSEDVGLHPDRIERLSNDVDVDMDDDFTPAPEPIVPTTGFNMMPLGSCKSRLETSTNAGPGPVSATTSQPPVPLPSEYINTPAIIPAPTLVSASEELDTWGSDEETEPTASGPSTGAELYSWGTGTDNVPASSALDAGEDFGSFVTGTDTNLGAFGLNTTATPAPSSFGGELDLGSFGTSATMAPAAFSLGGDSDLGSFGTGALMAQPSASVGGGGSDFGGSSSSVTMGPPPCVMAPPPPRPAPIILDGRTRQEIFDDFCQEKDNIIYADSKRRKANGTIPYEVYDEEFALILSRLSVIPNKLALATVDFSAKPGESFLKHKGDVKFMVGGRLNDKGHALTKLDEETTFMKINELGRGAIMRLVQTKPGPEKLVSRFERKAMSKVEKGKVERIKVKRTPSVMPELPVVEEDKEKKKVKEAPIGLGIVTPSPSKQEDAEAKALADIGIDVGMEL